MQVVGVVREWLDDEGWGVVDSAATPGGCWVHFSDVVASGYRHLVVGQSVTFTFVAVPQDGFAFRATSVWPPAAFPGAPPPPPSESPGAYSSTLTIRIDEEPSGLS
jgi:cold shock protein